MEIKELREGEIIQALDLVWEVFLEFEAPDYPQKGVDEFRKFLKDKIEIDKLCLFGAFVKNKIVGVLAMRGEHISLFFVKKTFIGLVLEKPFFNIC